jgi:predicted helicase
VWSAAEIWASNRLADDGIIAFISNRSFIDSRTFDGFRKVLARDFNEIYVVDLGRDVRANPKLSGTKHNHLDRRSTGA